MRRMRQYWKEYAPLNLLNLAGCARRNSECARNSGRIALSREIDKITLRDERRFNASNRKTASQEPQYQLSTSPKIVSRKIAGFRLSVLDCRLRPDDQSARIVRSGRARQRSFSFEPLYRP